ALPLLSRRPARGLPAARRRSRGAGCARTRSAQWPARTAADSGRHLPHGAAPGRSLLPGREHRMARRRSGGRRDRRARPVRKILSGRRRRACRHRQFRGTCRPGIGRCSRPAVNLASWVLVGGVLGVLAGITFGESCAILSPLGFAYVGLLQAAVYPYLVCSLLHGLGSLDPAKAWRLLKSGWVFYLVAWAITFACLAALAQGIPPVQPAVIGDHPVQPQSLARLLGLLIPTDLFTALSENYVPAVVVFCIFYGIALQTLKDKAPLLSILESIRLASLRFWNWIVRLAPLGVFALFAVTAGTTSFADLLGMGLYLGLFLLGTCLLAFWVLPALLSALAPVGHREIITELRPALAIAAVTTLSVAALPFVVEATRKLAERCEIAGAERDEIIRTNLSVAYPLGQLGNFFVYLFLVFAAYYYKVPLQGRDQALLPFMTLLSGFGSPTSAVNAVDFLSGWLSLPGRTRELYVELQTITRYGQVIVSVMAFAFLSVLVTLAYYGRLRLRLRRLVAALVLPAIGFVAIAWAGNSAHGYFRGPDLLRYGSLTLDPAITRGVEASVERVPERAAAAGAMPAGGTVERIQQRGVLRVGYNGLAVPFSYFNDAGALVGYDVEFAYDLARYLNVRLSVGELHVGSSSAPTAAPIAVPPAMAPKNHPTARPRRLNGTTSPIRVRQIGTIPAALKPVAMRHAINDP